MINRKPAYYQNLGEDKILVLCEKHATELLGTPLHPQLYFLELATNGEKCERCNTKLP